MSIEGTPVTELSEIHGVLKITSTVAGDLAQGETLTSVSYYMSELKTIKSLVNKFSESGNNLYLNTSELYLGPAGSEVAILDKLNDLDETIGQIHTVL